ncbi:DNA/RNA nuclease SfsA [Salmonella enterica subsp. enterica]|nr:DNA/RNA nuclease SfsA [Salmonella enterica subsp. enterica]
MPGESPAGAGGYNILKSEVKYGAERSRIILYLQANFRPDCYIEVKSVTLAERKRLFSRRHHRTRGKKHLRRIDGRAAAGIARWWCSRCCTPPLRIFTHVISI